MLLPFPVPRSYFDHMYHRLRNGQVWELSPTQVNFTNSELNFHFSPRPAVLFYVFQFSIFQAQGQPVIFSQVQAAVAFGFRIQTNVYGSQGHVLNRWYFDYFAHFGSMPIRFDSSTLLGRATLQGFIYTFRSCKV